MEPITISRADAMAMLGIGKTKLHELMADGSLATARLGRRRLIYLDSLKAFAERCRVA